MSDASCTPAPTTRRSGPKTLFPGKDRARPTSVAFTPEGHAALARGREREGLSTSDYIEKLVRAADARIGQDTHAAA